MLKQIAPLIGRIYASLVRETSGGKLIPEIDGLRFFAILSVLAYHISGFVTVKTPNIYLTELEDDVLTTVFAQGGVGVQLFFVISAFIVGIPFAKHRLANGKPVEMPLYFLRRLTRIEPPYVIALTVIFVLQIGMLGFSHLREQWMHYLTSIFYVHYWVYGSGSTVMAVAWSLEIEVQFYILAPILASVFSVESVHARRLILLGGVIVGGFLGSLHASPIYSPLHNWTLLGQLHWFLIGFLLADFYVLDKLRADRLTVRWDVIGVCTWMSIGVVVANRFGIHFLLPWLILLAYISAFRGIFLNRFVRLPPVYVIGGMCYTIYMYHGIVKSAVGRFLIPFQFTPWLGVDVFLQIVLIGSIIIAICSVLFVCFEKPFMSRALTMRVLGLVFRRNAKPTSHSHISLVEPK